MSIDLIIIIMLMYFFNSRINLYTIYDSRRTIEVLSDSSEEDVERVVDWTPETLSNLSEIKEETVDDGNDEEEVEEV